MPARMMTAERCSTDGDGDQALAHLIAEILAVHQQQGGRCDESDNNRAQSHKGTLDERALAMALDVVGGNQGEDERRQHDGEGGHQRAEHATRDDIADVGGAVDADGARRHLRDGDDVGEHLAGNPSRIHHLALDEREHRVTPAEAEQADFQVGPDEFQVFVKHRWAPFRSFRSTTCAYNRCIPRWPPARYRRWGWRCKESCCR